MKRYNLSFVVSKSGMTRHDINAWIKKTQQQAGLTFNLADMLDGGGQIFVNNAEGQSICAIATEFDEENPDIIESVNAQPKH